jgi:hypothetical protein
LALGRINPLNLGWRAPFDKLFGESAVATANVNPLQTAGHRQPIKEYFSCKSTPGPHHPFVGGPVIEKDLRFGH